MSDLKPIQGLRPFTKFCCTIGNLPASYLAGMTYEEQLLWFCDYLQNTVIPTVNNNAEAVEELQNLYVELKSYVDNYFTNLDVQEEINNKLDEMAENGSLTDLIKKYVDPIYKNYENTINQKVDNQNAKINQIDNKVTSIASGTPTVVNSTEEMTDTSKIYINTTDGNWYYYNGSNWTIGGKYQTTGIGAREIKQDNLADDISQNYILNMRSDFNWESGNINSNGSLGNNTNRARTTNNKFLKKGTIINVNPNYSLGIHQYIDGVHKIINDSISTLFVIDTDAEYRFTIAENPYGTYENSFYESDAFQNALNNVIIELPDKINTQNLAVQKLSKGYDFLTLARYDNTYKLLIKAVTRFCVFLDATHLRDFYVSYDNSNFDISLLSSTDINTNNFEAYYVTEENAWTTDNNIKLKGGNQYLIVFRAHNGSELELSEDYLFNNISYKLTSDDIYNIQNQISQIGNNEELIDSSFSDEIEQVKTELSNNQNGNTLSFAFITDLHLDSTNEQQLKMYKNMCNSLKELINSSNIDFISFGGDNTYNLWPPSLEKQKEIADTFRSLIYNNTKKPLLIANGNHDDNSIRNAGVSQNNQVYTPTVTLFGYQLYNYYAKMNENTKVVFGELGNNYCYIDLPTHKVRVFLLNSVDVPYTLNDSGQLEYTAQWTFAYRNKQLNFIANALKFEDKGEDSENWKAIFIEHVNLPNTPTFSDIDIINNDILVAIINAYQNGTSYNATNEDKTWGYNINVTYNHKGEVIASFGGHMHTNLYQDFNNIACINTETARYTDRVGFNNLVDKTAFDIFTIDFENKTIKATRFGYGDNREFTFK